MFGGSDKKIYTFPTSGFPTQQNPTTIAETEEEIIGAAVYELAKDDYLYLVAFEESITVYSKKFKELGTITIDAGEGLELSDIATLQSETKTADAGLIAYAFESDEAGKTFGVSSLEAFFKAFDIRKNTKWSPKGHDDEAKLPKFPAVKNCGDGGICASKTTCECYIGFAGADCSRITCKNDCSGNGSCVAANTCKCKAGFAGDDCSTISVVAQYETEANGADGDDPAIWIAPKANNSLIITTTKSEDNPGLSVFDLKGKKLQSFSAEEPNNVDVIYAFPISETEKIDLAYAACRGDNTLWSVTSSHIISHKMCKITLEIELVAI